MLEKQQTDTATPWTTADEQALHWVWFSQHLDDIPPATARMLERRRAHVEASDNPLVQAAHSIVTGQTLSPAEEEIRPVVAQLLTAVYNWAPPNHLQQLAEKAAKEVPKPSPVTELLERATGQKPVMVAPFSHFEGDYPKPEARKKKCGTYTVGGLRGEWVTSMKGAVWELWRPMKLKNGSVVVCEHCIHSRVMGFCEDIEAVSRHYDELDRLRYLIIRTKEYRALSDRIRKHNQRNPDDLVTYTSFPLKTGLTVVLHDSPGWLGGERLPAKRAALYTLVSGWYLPPKGKRSAHGLSTWAKLGPKGERPELEQEPEESSEKEGRSDEGQKQPATAKEEALARWLVRKPFWFMKRLLSKHRGERFGQKGMSWDPGEFSWEELADLLDKAGVDYGRDEGDGWDVTVSGTHQEPPSTNRDEGPPPTVEETPEKELNRIVGPPQPPLEPYFGGAT